MKIVIRAVGKLRDRRVEALCDEYVDRVRRHLPIEVVEVDDEPALAAGVPPTAELVALDARGDLWSTEDLERFLAEHMNRGTKNVVFLIGGAEGLSPATLARSRRKLSLSKMIFPHRLARLVLCEQVYRALSSLRGEPYHRP